MKNRLKVSLKKLSSLSSKELHLRKNSLSFFFPLLIQLIRKQPTDPSQLLHLFIPSSATNLCSLFLLSLFQHLCHHFFLTLSSFLHLFYLVQPTFLFPSCLVLLFLSPVVMAAISQLETLPQKHIKLDLSPLIGLIISQKTQNNQSVNAALTKAWFFAIPFSFAVLGPNTFLFKFTKKDRISRILNQV